jgi:hypothetical protein
MAAIGGKPRSSWLSFFNFTQRTIHAQKIPQEHEFDSYESFKKNFKISIPKNFNFAYDVVDEYARKHRTR